MKGDPKIIKELNKNIALEHGAIVQYVTHSGLCQGMGLYNLSEYIMSRAKDEMRHLDSLVDRVIFLEGTPEVSAVKGVNIGKTVEEMFKNDHAGELTAIEEYEKSIAICMELNDTGTRELFEKHLHEEEGHTDIIENNISQQKLLGMQNYLATQVD